MSATASSETPRVVIAGAGPAGLTAAYTLLRSDHSGPAPIIFEATDAIGGISQTVCHNGNRIDIGGHRFFSKSDEVMDFWREVMPMQTSPAVDELLLGATPAPDTEADPEAIDRVMLKRRRVSRIYYLRRFFDYPVRLSFETIRGMGIGRTLRAGFGYLATKVKKLPDSSLENFYINRFGRPLYSMFFEDYTEKVWGVHPSKLGADWGSQRVKGLSITAILRDIISKQFSSKRDSRKVETSLIEEFIYPKLGPGQLWETVASDVRKAGGDIEMNTEVTRIHVGPDRRIDYVEVSRPGVSEPERVAVSEFISSMPIADLVARLDGIDVPADVYEAATSLPYRDFITVGLLVPKLKIKNETKLRTYADRIPDTWIYVQERDVRLGRIQVFNNWSPYMVKDFKDHVWIGLEYFCNEGDDLWEMTDDDFISMAKAELASIGIIDADDVIDAVRIKIRKAYPAYFGSYYSMPAIRAFLDTIPNLYCVGRNGQHRYNNMDHSMLTAMEAARAIAAGSSDKAPLWEVNTEQEYHETKK